MRLIFNQLYLEIVFYYDRIVNGKLYVYMYYQCSIFIINVVYETM